MYLHWCPFIYIILFKRSVNIYDSSRKQQIFSLLRIGIYNMYKNYFLNVIIRDQAFHYHFSHCNQRKETSVSS